MSETTEETMQHGDMTVRLDPEEVKEAIREHVERKYEFLSPTAVTMDDEDGASVHGKVAPEACRSGNHEWEITGGQPGCFYVECRRCGKKSVDE